MNNTEEDTFNTLRQTPLVDYFLDIIEVDESVCQQTFVGNITKGLYDSTLQQHHWTRDAFFMAYYKKYMIDKR